MITRISQTIAAAVKQEVQKETGSNLSHLVRKRMYSSRGAGGNQRTGKVFTVLYGAGLIGAHTVWMGYTTKLIIDRYTDIGSSVSDWDRDPINGERLR